jgi:hypothetical protein
MKKIALAIWMFTVASNLLLAQEAPKDRRKNPEIMVVPSDNWCIQNGFIETFDDQGTSREVPNYKKAFQNSSDLLSVLAGINQAFASRSMPALNLEQELKKLEAQSAEDALLTSKSGAGVSESPMDRLMKTAKADIIIQLTWTVNRNGMARSVTFTLQGLDAYTGKEIASATGTGPASYTPELAVMLEEAVSAHMDNFLARLQEHFDDLLDKGRAIEFRVKTFSSWDKDLETEDYGDDELSSLIEKWVGANTVDGNFNLVDASENMMLFKDVRISFFDDKGKALSARSWANALRKHLKDTYQIESKLMTKGLGQAQLVIGEK